jgi:hypothetical protein
MEEEERYSRCHPDFSPWKCLAQVWLQVSKPCRRFSSYSKLYDSSLSALAFAVFVAEFELHHNISLGSAFCNQIGTLLSRELFREGLGVVPA